MEVSLLALELRLAGGQITSPDLHCGLDCSENPGTFQELRHVTVFASQMEFPGRRLGGSLHTAEDLVSFTPCSHRTTGKTIVILKAAQTQ